MTPVEIAQIWRVSAAKVLGWIHRGDLLAINVAGPGATRPIFRIAQESLKQFEAARQHSPPPPPAPRVARRRRTAAGDSKAREYF